MKMNRLRGVAALHLCARGVALVALARLAPEGVADDWPQWRGPGRDGVWNERGLVELLPVEGVKVRWRVAVGAGFSSPVVAEDRVYVTDAQPDGTKTHERVLCFDATSGAALWTHAYEVVYPAWAFTPDQNNGPCATPSVADGRVYVLGGNGDVFCLEAATGAVAWHRDLGEEHAIETLLCRPSPLVDGEQLIVVTGGKPGACVVALARNSGRELWRALDESVSNSSPIIVTAGGRRQLIVWTGQSVSALDPATGALLWREPMTTSSNDATATPVCVGDRLLVSGLMFRLAADRPAATVLWPENRGVTKRVLSNTSTPMFTGDLIFSAMNQGELVCLDPDTGTELWRTDQVTDRKGGASVNLTANGDAVWLYTNRGELIRARLSRLGYEEVSRTKVLSPTQSFGGRKVAWAAPAYANRRIFARSERELVCGSLEAELR